MSIENIKIDCCMCKNCLRVCKFNAINLKIDKYGFEYAILDRSKCKNCGLCDKVCPVKNINYEKERVYSAGIAYSLDEYIKRNGSSGGLFGCFAKNVIENKGCVYGASFDKKMKLKTTKAEKEEELFSMYKSKYLLCDTNSQFQSIKHDLDGDRFVLYCSTPCQIEALKLFLKKDYENLITIDFVCHGVSSQFIFDRFCQMYEQQHKCKITTFQFRKKIKNPSSSHYFSIGKIKNGKKLEKKGLYFFFPYYNAYCKQIINRPNCYDCKFATKKRVSDITIGDFHTINKYRKNINRFEGVSMFLCNTKKGELFFNRVKENLFVEKISLDTLYSNNRFTKSNSEESKHLVKNSRIFLDQLLNFGITHKAKKMLFTKKDFFKIIYYKCPAFIRRIVKDMI